VLFQVAFEFLAKILIAHLPLYAGTGIRDGAEIRNIGEDTFVQGPLPATPWFTGMDRAALLGEKNTVAVHGLHLHDPVGNPQKFFEYFLPGFAQITDQTLLILLVQGNGGFSLTAVTALPATENFGFFYLHALLRK